MFYILRLCFSLFLLMFYFSCEDESFIPTGSGISNDDIVIVGDIAINSDDYNAIVDLFANIYLTDDDFVLLNHNVFQIDYDNGVVVFYGYFNSSGRKISSDTGEYGVIEGIVFSNTGIDDFQFANISKFLNLKTIEIRDENNLVSISTDLPNLVNLESLEIDSCNDLENIDAFKGIENLKTLEISFSDELIFDSDFFYSFPSIEDIRLRDLPSINLELTSLILNLPYLEDLDIYNSNITGTLPIELFLLDDIERIEITRTFIEGSLPEVEDFDDLKYLNLSYNNLSGDISDDYCNNSNSWDVAIEYNSFCGYIPSCISSYGADNQFCNDENFDFNDYYYINGNYYLKVDYDALQAIIDVSNFSEWDDEPLELCSWSYDYRYGERFYYVKSCYFQGDGFVDIDGYSFNELATLSSLTTLVITSEDDVVGPIPSSIGQLENLETLILVNLDDLIGALPDEIGDLQNLIHLEITNNHDMAGEVPLTIWNLTNLEYISIENLGADLLIPLTSDIGNLTNLSIVNFYNINFSGINPSLPSEIFTISDIKEILISYTNIEGEIPSSIGDLDDITNLDLSHNNLSGDLPESIVNIRSLTNLDLSYNNILSVPSNMCDMTLDYIGCLVFELENNGLCGQEGIIECYCEDVNSIYLDVCP